MKQATTASADLMTRIIPLKHDLEEVDLEADGDTEQTTASIKSVSTPAKNQFEMDEPVGTMETVQEVDATTPKESEGRVKRFFNEIKNNCKTADTVIESEWPIRWKHSYFGNNSDVRTKINRFFSSRLQWKKVQCNKSKAIH